MLHKDAHKVPSVIPNTPICPIIPPSSLTERFVNTVAGSSARCATLASSHLQACLNPVDSGEMAMKHLSAAGEVPCFQICFPHRVPPQRSFSSLMLCN